MFTASLNLFLHYFFTGCRKRGIVSNIISPKRYLEPWQTSVMEDFFVKINNPLTTNVPYHIETSDLICSANQLTGFYMMGNTSR